MLQKIVLTCIFFGASLSHSQSITSCQNPEGYAYYHYSGRVPKDKSGFAKDKITGGMVTLQKLGDNQFDILFVDVNKQIISAVGDGGKVMLVRKGKTDATFIHFFSGKVVEIYTFWVDSEGLAKYDLVQSKGGDLMPIHKYSMMVGTCSQINFDLINY